MDLRGGTSILGLMGHIQEQGEMGRQRGNAQGLAGLLSKGMTANPMQQREMLAKGAAIDPAGTMEVAGMLQGQEEDALDRFGKLSTAAAATKDPHVFRQWVQAGVAANMLPPEAAQRDFSNPADIDGASRAAQAFAQAFGGAGAPEQYTLSPGAARYDAAGNLVAERPFAPTRDDWTVTNVPDGQGGQVQMEHNRATGEWRQPSYAGAAPSAAAPSGGGRMVMDDALTNAMIGVESGGDPNAVSPAGARGLMQVMPQTGQDPGYGVRPLQNDSPQENVRFGQDYYSAMLDKYGGNQVLALAAYNGGPGRVDEALQKAGGDPQRAMQYLPEETQQYPGKVQARLGRTPPPKPSAPSGYRYNDRGDLEAIPGGPAAKPPAAANSAAATKARQKLTQIQTARQQLNQVKANFAKLKGTFSAGMGGGLLPTQDGEAFDRSVRNLAPLITAVTRVPGVGSMSDYEAKLQEASLPSRGTYEQTTMQQIADLERLLDTIESGYTGLGDEQGQPANDDARRRALLDKY